MSIADCISRLQTASTNIAPAITDMGGTVTEGDGFEEYPADIRTIPTGSEAISVSISATATNTSVVLTLDKAIPVALTATMTISGDSTSYTIASGATTLNIVLSSSNLPRTANFSITANSYATLFDLTYPASVEIPYERRVVNLTVGDITSSGCTVTADDYPSEDVTITVSLAGETYTGVLYNDSLTCEITWDTQTLSTTAYISCSVGVYAEYVLDVTDFTVPGTGELPLVELYISNVTATGCHIGSSEAVASNLTITVARGESGAFGYISVGETECDISWEESALEETVAISVSPSADATYEYALEANTITIPARAQTYTTLTYIEATGTQYIETDITTASGMVVTGKFYGVAPSSTTGATNGTNSEWLWKAGNQNNFLLYNGGSRLYGSNGSYAWYQKNSSLVNGRYIKTIIAIDGGTTSTASRSGYIIGTSASVFESTSFSKLTNSGWSASPTYDVIYLCCNENTAGPSACRFYGMEITEDGSVTHNLIPAMRDSDSVVGVLDSVTDTFYENAGTGTFLYA